MSTEDSEPSPRITDVPISELRAAFDLVFDLPHEERKALLAARFSPAVVAASLRMLARTSETDSFLDPLAVGSPNTPIDEAPPWPPATRLVSRYTLHRLIGEGGASWVYEAEDEVLSQRVAIKVPKLRNRAARTIRNEAMSLRLLDLPGLVRLVDDDEQDGLGFLVEEYIEGSPFPGSGGGSTWEELRQTALSLVECVERMHAAGVTHGDLKPGNALVTERGRVVLVDLGLAREVAHGSKAPSSSVLSGTPEFMAPELLHGRSISRESDLFALGRMLRGAVQDAMPSHFDAFVAGLCDETPSRRRDAMDAWRKRTLARAATSQVLSQPESLQGHFHGFNRVHHIREDAAKELIRRVKGSPTEIRTELEAWERAGIGRFESGRLHISRAAISRLAAGLRVRGEPQPQACAERQTASMLMDTPPTELGVRAFGERAYELAKGLVREGDLNTAAVALREWSTLLRRSEPHAPSAEACLSLTLECALRLGRKRDLDLALYLIQRLMSHTSSAERLERTARAALLAIQGDIRRGLETLPEASSTYSPSELRCTLSVWMFLARRSSLEVHERELLRAEQALLHVVDLSVHRPVLSARAWLLERNSVGSGVAAMHIELMRSAEDPTAHLGSLVNAARALIGEGRLREAEPLIRNGLKDAANLRHAPHEATLERFLRVVKFRRGDCLKPDMELLEATREVGNPHSLGLCALTEAAVAWRCDDLETGARIADLGLKVWRHLKNPASRLAARGMALACRDTRSPATLSSLKADVLKAKDLHTQIQVAGLMGWHQIARDAARKIPNLDVDQCGLFMPPREAMQ